MTQEEEKNLARANAFENIEDTQGWHVVLEQIENIRREAYEKWLKLPAEKMTTKTAFDLRAQAQSCRELLTRLELLKNTRRQAIKRQPGDPGR